MKPDRGYLLVVDDDAAMRLFFSRHLQKQNHWVEVASEGQQAMELLRSRPFDLVLLDLVMPGMSGYQVLSQLKADPELRSIPVIVISSQDDLDSVIRCIELGAEDYLTKPANSVLLKARVNTCLERKRLRDQEYAYLQQLEAEKIAAEAANRAKSAFLANMSHELRTPLNAVIGYSEILKEDVQAEGYTEFVPDLDKIQSAGKHLLGLINDILDISKIEAGKMDLYLETFEIGGLVEDVVRVVQPLTQKNRNRLEVRCAENLGTMYADLTKVRHILLNLLSNAAKFTEQGTVTLEVRRDSATGVDPDWVTFCVADTGIGMAPEQMQHIFEAFMQGDASTTRKYGGTGLGLAISHRFCQMLGGTLTVTSQAGQGSTFTLRLPLQVSELPPNQLRAEPKSTASTVTVGIGLVLVIDDDRQVRDRLVRALNQQGLRVVTAWSGEEGIRLARELQPSAIVLDLLLPQTEAWAVLSALKATPELAATPVVLLAIAEAEQQGIVLGLADALMRPTDFKRLATCLTPFLASAQTTNPTAASVLIVEDDITPREIMQRLLQKEGWQVYEAGDRDSALQQLTTIQPQLILLNLMLPEMIGLSFWAELRQHPDWQSIPVAGITTRDLTASDRTQLNEQIEAILRESNNNPDQAIAQVCKWVSTVLSVSRINT